MILGQACAAWDPACWDLPARAAQGTPPNHPLTCKLQCPPPALQGMHRGGVLSPQSKITVQWVHPRAGGRAVGAWPALQRWLTWRAGRGGPTLAPSLVATPHPLTRADHVAVGHLHSHDLWKLWDSSDK